MQKIERGFVDYFKDFPDPRLSRNQLHSISEIVFVTLYTSICGAEGWQDVEDFGSLNLSFLIQHLYYKKVIPTDDNLRRFFRNMTPQSFQALFYNWVNSCSKNIVDAIGCQYKIADKIISKEVEFSLKGNRELLEDIELDLEEQGFLERSQYCEYYDKGHSRIEIRKIWVTNDVQWLRVLRPEWLSINSILRLESTRKINGNCENYIIAEIKQAIKSNSCNIDLSSLTIEDEDLKFLSDALKGNKIVKKIDFKSGISDAGAKHIIDLLEHNDTIFEISGYDGIENTELKFEIQSKLWKNEIRPKVVGNHAFKFQGSDNVSALEDGYKIKALCKLLSDNQTVTDLHLNDIMIHDEGAVHIGDLLASNSTIIQLDLSNCAIGNEVRKILEDLEKNQAIIDLNLSYNAIGLEGAIHLGDFFVNNSTITQLNLSYCDIGPNGLHSICEALKKNQTITDLDLSQNVEIAYSALDIVDLLASNSTITKLNLSDCRIRFNAVRKIFEAIEKNQTITDLDLSFNFSIADEGAVHIGDRLAINSTITKLNLSDCNIGPNGFKSICEALQKNTKITHINLALNNIGYEDLAKITKLLNINKEFAEFGMPKYYQSTQLSITSASDLPYVKYDIIKIILKYIAILSKYAENRQIL